MKNRLRIPLIAKHAEEMVKVWEVADKSDPFIRDRILSHYNNGIGSYGGELVNEQRSFIGQDGREKIYSVSVAKNLERP